MNRYVFTLLLLVGFFCTTTLPSFAQDGFPVVPLPTTPTPGTEFPDVGSIPTPGDGEIIGVYEAGTGSIYLSIGPNSGLQVFGLTGAPFTCESLNAASELGTPNCGPDGLGFVSLAPFPLGGPFDLGPLLPADPSIRTAEDFRLLYPNASVGPGLSRFSVIPAPAASVPEPTGALAYLLVGLSLSLRRCRSACNLS